MVANLSSFTSAARGLCDSIHLNVDGIKFVFVESINTRWLWDAFTEGAISEDGVVLAIGAQVV